MSRWLKIRTHHNGTVSYYSDIEKKWIMNVTNVPARELALMTLDEKFCLLKYLEKHKPQAG